MVGDWTSSELGELTINFDGKRKPVKESNRRPGPYPYYGASGIVDYVDGYLFEGDYLLIAEDGENLRTRQTPIAFIARGKFWVNNHAHIVVGNENADTRFLMYALHNADTDEYLTGAVMPKLTQGNLNRIEISHPCLAEQRRIAHILGTLDDKIENNRKTAKTLEAMAQAIFQSWFVDFDPVRAKMAGESKESICKRLKLTPEILGLFPDRLADSELGEIPEGWEVGKLGNILYLRKERCAPSKEISAIPYVPIECISSKSIYLLESKSGVEAQSSLTKFYKKDIIFGAMRPYFHKVCIAPFDGTTRTTAFVLYPKINNDFAFCLFTIFSDNTIDYASANSTGSTIPYAVWDNSLEYMPQFMPTEKLRAAFNEVVDPMLKRLSTIPYEIFSILSDLRDTLLPKLISGEVRVPETKQSKDAIKNSEA